MKALKFVVKLLLLIVLAVLVVGLFLPEEWETTRTLVVDASPEQIHPFVADLRHWDEWSAWNSRKDPTMELSFSGAESGLGAIEEWTSEELGVGRMEVTAASPEGVEYFLTFEDMPDPLYGSFRFAPTEGGTEIVWKSWGSAGSMPWEKVLTQIFVPLINHDLDEGLSGLATLVEGASS